MSLCVRGSVQWFTHSKHNAAWPVLSLRCIDEVSAPLSVWLMSDTVPSSLFQFVTHFTFLLSPLWPQAGVCTQIKNSLSLNANAWTCETFSLGVVQIYWQIFTRMRHYRTIAGKQLSVQKHLEPTSSLFMFVSFCCKLYTECPPCGWQNQLVQAFSLIPFSTLCSAACGFSPRVRRWCPARGSRPSEGSDTWAPGGPAPPRWSRSPVHWGSGYAPWAPALQRKNKVMPLFEQRHWLDDRDSRRWVLIIVSYMWYKHDSCPRWLCSCCSACDSSVITLTESATYTTNNSVWFDKLTAKDVVTSELLLFTYLNSM